MMLARWPRDLWKCKPKTRVTHLIPGGVEAAREMAGVHSHWIPGCTPCDDPALVPHTRTRTRHVGTGPILAPGDLPSIGAGSEPKLVPARAVFKGEIIGAHEMVPVRQVKARSHALNSML